MNASLSAPSSPLTEAPISCLLKGAFDPQGWGHNKPPLLGLEAPQRINHEDESDQLVIMGPVCKQLAS